jgi:hypothetical protein
MITCALRVTNDAGVDGGESGGCRESRGDSEKYWW